MEVYFRYTSDSVLRYDDQNFYSFPGVVLLTFFVRSPTFYVPLPKTGPLNLQCTGRTVELHPGYFD